MGYQWSGIRRIFKYCFPLIYVFELFYLLKYGKSESQFPTVYIIGPPRTGSTIIYQLITSYLDVLYIDNLTELSRNNLFFGIWLSQKLYKEKAHKNFSSNIGRTHNAGLHAPNEGLFWYRFLPRGKHYVNSNDVSSKNKKWLIRYHNAVKNKFQKPFVIKNLSFSMRLDLIKEIEPNAKFIHVTRDPFFTAQSIYLARKKESWPNDKLWSIQPKHAKEIEKLPIFEQITKQIDSINQQIEGDLTDFKNGYMKVKYEDVCHQTSHVIKKIMNFIASNHNPKSGLPPDHLDIQNTVKLNSHEETQLKQVLHK
ncbi:MAG: hypothetical protein GVY19_03980 [Bacteroidetes bacterium]|jgi:hypothetical protein|nr:hypothetical protein [Bacteroidota bacterium]